MKKLYLVLLSTLFGFAGIHAATIFSSPVSGEVGFGSSYAGGNWYHQISQNTGQSYQLDQFALHVNVGSSSSTHNLSGSYSLDIFSSSAGAKGSLLGNFAASNIGNQFVNGSSSYRTFTFDITPGAVVLSSPSTIYLYFKTTDTVPIYTHASGVGASTGWGVYGKLLSGGTFYNVGNTLGTVSVSAVPEPGSGALLAAGMAAWVLMRGRRAKPAGQD